MGDPGVIAQREDQVMLQAWGPATPIRPQQLALGASARRTMAGMQHLPHMQ